MPDPSNAPNILIMHTGGLKSFAASLPDMARLNEYHKGANITLMTSKRFVDLAAQTGYFDKIWEISIPPRYRILKRFSLYRRFKSFQYDCVYNLGDVPLSYALNTAMPQDAVNAPVRTDWCQQNLDYYQLPKRFALIAPGGKGRNAWPANRFGTLAKKLCFHGITPVLIGLAQDYDAVKRVHKICPEAIDPGRHVSLVEMAAFACRAEFMVGHHSGIAMLADFSNCPVLALYPENEDPTKSNWPKSEKVICLQDDLTLLSVADTYAMLQTHGFLAEKDKCL